MRHRFNVFLMAAMILGFADYGPTARAQDDADEEEQPAQPRQGLFATDELFEQWFDTWVFGRGGGVVQNGRIVVQPQTAARLREEFDAELAARLHNLNRRYGLTAEELRKLKTAGKRDIQRYFDSVEEMKRRLRAVRDDRDQFIAILNQRQRNFLVKRQGGENLFGEGSLLAKTWKTTLSADRSHHKAAPDVYRTHVEWVFGQVDEQIGLTAQQHRQFVDLIAEETVPLQRYGPYDAYAVLFQASRLPEARVERILNRTQILLLHEVFREARAFENVLVANGYLARDDADENRRDADLGAKRKSADVRIARPAPVRGGFTGR